MSMTPKEMAETLRTIAKTHVFLWASVKLREVADYLDSLPAEDGWVGVEERLPDSYGTQIVAIGGTSMASCFNDETQKWETDMLNDLQGVTHWRPLPEPPKETK